MHLFKAAFLSGLLLHGATSFGQERDFGEARLEAGREAFAQRRYLEAIADFRIASFALVDRPARLLESLARLALSQSAAQHPADEQKATLERFLEVERQFQVYSELDLEPEIRGSFLALLGREIPAEALSKVPQLSAALAGRRGETRTTLARGATTAAPPATQTASPGLSASESPWKSPTARATQPPLSTERYSPSSVPTGRPVPPSATVPTRRPTSFPTRTPRPASPTPGPAKMSTRTQSRTPIPPSANPTPVPFFATRVSTGTPPVSRVARTSTVAPTPSPLLRGPQRPLRPMSIVNPVYPPQDVKEPIRGVVVMRVLVSETGVPVEVVVVQRAPGTLTEAAVAAVRQWRFEPAIQNGRAFRAWTIVGIPFEAIPFPQPSPTETPPARRSTPGTGSASLHWSSAGAVAGYPAACL